MSKSNKSVTTFEIEMRDPSFKKEFDAQYKEFALSELLLSLMEGDSTSVRKLAKAATHDKVKKD